MERLMGHSHYFYQNYFSGNLATKINDIIVGVPKLLTTAIDQFFSDALALVLALITVWSVDICFMYALLIWLAVFFYRVRSLLFTKSSYFFIICS